MKPEDLWDKHKMAEFLKLKDDGNLSKVFDFLIATEDMPKPVYRGHALIFDRKQIEKWHAKRGGK